MTERRHALLAKHAGGTQASPKIDDLVTACAGWIGAYQDGYLLTIIPDRVGEDTLCFLIGLRAIGDTGVVDYRRVELDDGLRLQLFDGPRESARRAEALARGRRGRIVDR